MMISAKIGRQIAKRLAIDGQNIRYYENMKESQQVGKIYMNLIFEVPQVMASQTLL